MKTAVPIRERYHEQFTPATPEPPLTGQRTCVASSLNLYATISFENVTRARTAKPYAFSEDNVTNGGIMNAIDRVANVLLGNRGNNYCDSCLAESLAFEGRYEVQQVTSALADSASFQRIFGTCSMCRRDTLVIATNCAGRL